MNFRQVLLSVFTTLLYFQVGLSQLAITTPDDVNVLEGTTATADVTVTEDGNSATVTFVLYDKSEPVGSTNNPITPSTVISSGDYSITQNVDTYTFSWPTPTGSGRSYLVKVTADDGQNTVVDYFSVNVAQAIPGNILARTFASPLPWYGGSPGAGFTVAIEPPPAAKNIGWITDGEFVEYLIDVPVPGQLYLLEVFAGKGNNGTFNVNIMEEDGGGGFSQIGTVAKTKPPGTNPWQTYTPPITTQVSFSNAGLQTMRFDFQGAGGINIRDFEFTNAYTLDASAGTNGTIAPSGQLVLEEGADQTYTFTPDGGYEIEEVLVDGSPVTLTNDEYTFTNVMADATISVSFVASSVNTYTLTPTAGANGAIDPATAVVVNEGTNQLFTFTPDPGFQVADVLVDGSSVGAVNSYEFVNIIADATIAVSFEPIPFSPIYVNVGGGAYTAQGGTVFQADNGASGGTVYPTGSNQIMTLDGVDFTNTLDDELFRTERYGDYSVDFTVPNGDYVVDLYFAEIFQGVLGGGAALPGERVFDVAVEGNLVLDDFDAINPASGGAFAPATGIVKSFLVSVTDNEININVVTVVDNAKLSALCIREPGVANQAPVIAAIPNVSITAGQTASATISATDEVGVTGFQIQVIKDSDNSVVDPADYTFVQNGNSVDFDWVTTDPDDVGDYTATVLAFDGLDVSSANFPIAVAGPQDITVDPLSVDFGVVEVNVGSAPTMITISNSGGSDLSVSEINLINNGDAEFALSNLPGLPAAIPAGSSVDFEVDFTPVNLGAATATINIVSNDPSEGTVTISLSGEGSDNPPVITNPGEQRHFEDDVITLPITVTDNGTPTISVSGLPAGLTFNGSNEISGTIAAGAAAAGPYTVIISADDGINLPVEVTFDWLIYVPCENVLYRVNAGGPLLTSTDAGPDWGQDEGTGADASPYYVNNGGGDKTYTSNISGAVNMSHPSIPPGYPEALFVKERYDPPATANPANPAEMLYQFPVSIGAEIEVKLLFGEAFSGVTSAGQRVFDVSVEGVVPPVFDDIDPYGTAGPKGAFILSYTYIATDATLDVEFLHDVIENPAVKGFEICEITPPPSPEITVAPTSIDFGGVDENTSSAPETVTITNDGTGDLTVSAITLTNNGDGEFSLDNLPGLPATITAGNSATFEVSFAPVNVGLASASVAIVSDDANEGTLTVSLDGEGLLVPVPEITVAPTTIDFGGVDENTSSAPETVTITNDGTGDLTVSAITLTNNGDGEFSLDNLPGLPATITAGNSATFEVSFAPVNVGLASASVAIASDDANEGTLTVSLDGEGLLVPVPEITVAPTAIDFGGVDENTSSAPETVTITNDGTGDLTVSAITLTNNGDGEFSLDNLPGLPATITAGNSATFEVSFAPVNVGLASASVAIVSDDANEGTLTVSLDGEGLLVPVPEITVAPTAIDFGGVDENTSSAPETVTITNDGTGDLTVSAITLTNNGDGEFSLDNLPGLPATITAGNSATFEVSFAPVNVGLASASVAIVSDDANEGTLTVSLDGEGLLVPVPEITVAPTTIDFGGVDENTSSAPETVTITNDGTGDLTVSAITLTNNGDGEFSLDNLPGLPATITAGNSATFEVSFAPVNVGLASASVAIVSDDANEGTLTVSLDGEGLLVPVPEITVAPTTIDFGGVDENTSSAPETVTITNDGTGDLTVSAITLTNNGDGEFSLDNLPGLPATITAGNSATFEVSFAPVNVGLASASVAIVSDDANEGTVTVSLDGEGISTSTVLYRETFQNTTNDDGPEDNQSISLRSWDILKSDALPVGINAVTSDAIGAPVGLDNINAGDVDPTPADGFGLGAAFSAGNNPYLAFTEEFPIDLSSIEVTGINWYQGHASGSAETRAAIRINGQWYASASAFTNTAVGSVSGFAANAEAKSIPYTTTAADWVELTVDGTGNVLALGSTPATDLPTTGTIEAFGLYMEIPGSSGGFTLRFDTYEVEGTLINGSFPPVVINPGDQTNAEGEAINLQLAITDPDDATFTVTAGGLPANLSIDNTGLVTGSLAAGTASGGPLNDGVYPVTVSVNDGSNPDVTVNFNWTVTPNLSPTITNPGAQVNDEGDAVSLQITLGQDDGPGLSVAANGLPASLSIDNAGLISGTIDAGAATGGPNSDGVYSVTVTADDGLNPVVQESFTWTINAPVPILCSPIAFDDCSTIPVAVASSFCLEFDGSDGGLEDGSAVGTGFTMVAAPENNLDPAIPTFANVPGYEPDRLSIANDLLTITASKGIFFKTTGDNGNSQVNGLGVGFDADQALPFDITTKLVNLPVPNGGASFQQGGIWFGLGESEYVKLVALVNNTSGYRLQLAYEVADDLPSGNEQNATGNILAIGADVWLKMTIDPVGLTVTGAYSSDGVNFTPIGSSITLNQQMIDGIALPDASSSVTYAGLHATTRNANAANTMDFSFERFCIEPELILAIDPIQDITQDNDASVCEASVDLPDATFTNAVGNVSVVATVDGNPVSLDGELFPVGSTEVTYTATDDGTSQTASLTFNVIISDAEAPTISCPDNIVVVVAEGVTAEVVTYDDPTFSDNCTNPTLQQTLGGASGSSFPLGVTTNTFEVSDGTNTANCSFTVTLTSNLSPVLTNPGPQTNDEGDVVSLQIVLGQDDGPGLTVSASGLPSSLSMDNTGLISGTIDVGTSSGGPNSDGIYPVTVSADDGLNPVVEVSFNWTVNQPTADLTFNVELQGRNLPTPDYSGEYTVELYDPNDNSAPLFSFTETAGTDGVITLTDLPTGSYGVRVDRAQYLSRVMPMTTLTAGANTLDFTVANSKELRAGDANEDNAVSALDFSVMVVTFNKAVGDSGYNAQADFNGDGQVGALDFSLLASNFNVDGEEPMNNPFAAPTSSSKLREDVKDFNGQSSSAIQLWLNAAERLTVGEEVLLDLMVSTGDQRIDATQAYLAFDSELIEVLEVIPSTAGFEMNLVNAYDNTQGQVSVASGSLSDFPQGDILIAQVRIRAKHSGKVKIGFTAPAPFRPAVTFGGFDLLSNAKPVEIRIVDASSDPTEEIRLYPNPSLGLTTLEIPTSMDPVKMSYQLFDSKGREMRSQLMDGRHKQTIDLSNAPAGIYLVRIVNGTEIWNKRIVIE